MFRCAAVLPSLFYWQYLGLGPDTQVWVRDLGTGSDGPGTKYSDPELWVRGGTWTQKFWVPPISTTPP